ncbi:hypothetical protein SISSUDRAFT_278241 [Sistotremastrum suecicum HHB10207 ss-3]|uniref:Tuberin-type domain-containing protein n=1 Tax=Sistotremastrum suecicum HHB10207 ss-3 TaxID=1314776 RepID=A0A165ZLI5_9AGAM|nr:hypothetical protein SISSUDRAFT_278241 [Sistotremastrum suecicum HHB10207 ss-3]
MPPREQHSSHARPRPRSSTSSFGGIGSFFNKMARTASGAQTPTSGSTSLSPRRQSTHGHPLSAGTTGDPHTPMYPHSLPLDKLISQLSPPQHPTVPHVRALIDMLSSDVWETEQVPSLDRLSAILSGIFSNPSSEELRAAGMELITVYVSYHETQFKSPNDRLSLLLVMKGVHWSAGVWKKKQVALECLLGPRRDLLAGKHLDEFLTETIRDSLAGDDEEDQRLLCAEDTALLIHELLSDDKTSQAPRVLKMESFYRTLLTRNLESKGLLDPRKSMSRKESYTLPTVQSLGSPPSSPSPPTHKRNSSSISLSQSFFRGIGSPSSTRSPPPPITTSLSDPAISLHNRRHLLLAEIYVRHVSQYAPDLFAPKELPHTLEALVLLLSQFVEPLPRVSLHQAKLHFKARESSTSGSPGPTSSSVPLTEIQQRQKLEDDLKRLLNKCCTGPHASLAMSSLKSFLLPDSEASLSSSPGAAAASALLSLGTFRALRLTLRREMEKRMLQSFFREKSTSSPYGIPALSGEDLDPELMRYAFDQSNEDPKHLSPSNSGQGAGAGVSQGSGTGQGRRSHTEWSLKSFGETLPTAIRIWSALATSGGMDHGEAEGVVTEGLGLLKDALQEYEDALAGDDETGAEGQLADNTTVMDEEIGCVIGESLAEAVAIVAHAREPQGSPYILPLERPSEAKSRVLDCLCDLLGRDIVRTRPSPPMPVTPSLPATLLSISPHLSDKHSALIPEDLLGSTPSVEWIQDIETLFDKLWDDQRSLTKMAIYRAAIGAYTDPRIAHGVKRRIGDLIFHHWSTLESDVGLEDIRDPVFDVLRHELVSRLWQDQPGKDKETHSDDGHSDTTVQIQDYLRDVIEECRCHEVEDFPRITMAGDSSNSALPPSSTPNSPSSSRVHSDPATPIVRDEKRDYMPLLSHLFPPRNRGDERVEEAPPEPPSNLPSGPYPFNLPTSPTSTEARTASSVTSCRGASAVVPLVNAFADLAYFKPSLPQAAIDLFNTILTLLGDTSCIKARIVMLQFLMRLRSDHEHRIYSVGHIDSAIEPLAALVHCVRNNDQPPEPVVAAPEGAELGRSRTNTRSAGRREGSRGRGAQTNSSRSRSRAARPPPTPASKTRDLVWSIPESIPFIVPEDHPDRFVHHPNARIRTYRTPELEAMVDGPLFLPVSAYLACIIKILDTEADWDILTYVLTHLPEQLANKHFFCGVRTKEQILNLHECLCNGLRHETLGVSARESIPDGLKPRDAQGLGYHTLNVLISYRKAYGDNQKYKDLIVEVFLNGLTAGLPSTLICCIGGLMLAAYELRVATARYLPRIVERLAQIMSNPEVAVHVLTFLRSVASVDELYANFTEENYKMVFFVAFKYLEYHSNPDSDSSLSFSLTQHVLVMTFNIIYVWFHVVNIGEQTTHIVDIKRRLKLASMDGGIEEPVEVCFDWLTQYTFGTLGPRAVSGVVKEASDMRAFSTPGKSADERWWIVNLSLIAIRAHHEAGWVEIESRRAAGLTRFLIPTHTLPPGVRQEYASYESELSASSTLEIQHQVRGN